MHLGNQRQNQEALQIRVENPKQNRLIPNILFNTAIVGACVELVERIDTVHEEACCGNIFNVDLKHDSYERLSTAEEKKNYWR
jgi:hypothetical protein